jgi:hypothetical protein
MPYSPWQEEWANKEMELRLEESRRKRLNKHWERMKKGFGDISGIEGMEGLWNWGVW